MDTEIFTTAAENIATRNKQIEENYTEFAIFLKNNYNGLIKVLTNDADIAVTTRPLILAFHNFKKFGAQLRQWLDILHKLAQEYKCRVDFAITDFSSLRIGTQWNKFNYAILGPKSRPRIFALDLHGYQHRMNVGFNRENLTQFIDLLLKDRLFKSEPLPAESNEFRIKAVVAENFNELVLNNSKDIFIVFYAPWCLLSQELLSKLNELASLLHEQDELVIVIMNALDNYVPVEFNVFSYPRCFYIRKDDKNNHIQYDRGPHSVENLIKFIAENATNELQCWNRNGLLKKIYQNKTNINPKDNVLHLFNISDIKRIMNKNYNGLINVLTTTNEIAANKKPLILMYHNFRKFLVLLEPLCDVVEEVSKKYQEKVDFAITDIGLIDIGNILNKSGHTIFHTNAQPWIFAFDKHNNQYQMNEFLNVQNFNNFTENLLRNELARISIPLRLKNVEPLVKIAADANIEELVFDSRRDVFLVFLKSTCPFSSEFSTILEDLASLLLDDTDQMIVKMDVDENHIPPQFTVLRYPKCFYLKLDNKNNHILYDCWPRTIESLVKFIAAHSTTELTHYHRNGVLRNESRIWNRENSSFT